MYNHNIQGDNYNVPYYRQFSQWWILFELVSMLETCLSYTKSHEWSKERWRWSSGVHFRRCLYKRGVQKERGDCTHTTHSHSKKQYHGPCSCMTKKYFLPTKISYYIVLCSQLSSNGHFWKKDTSLKWTPRFDLCLSLPLSCTSNSTCI